MNIRSSLYSIIIWILIICAGVVTLILSPLLLLIFFLRYLWSLYAWRPLPVDANLWHAITTHDEDAIEKACKQGAYINGLYRPARMQYGLGILSLKNLLSPRSMIQILQTPLIHAIDVGCNTKIITMLINHHADVNKPDSAQATPLVHAVRKQHQTMVQILLDHGANPNAANEKNWTPLMEAVVVNNKSIAQQLLHYNADPVVINNQDENAYQIACSLGHTDIMHLLEKKMSAQ